VGTADGQHDRLDVDARFLLANDRTLLAWVRTALTLVTVGVGLLQFGTGGGRTAPAVAMLVLGTLSSTLGLLRYRRADRDLREGRLPPGSTGPSLLVGAVVLLCVALLVAALLGAFSSS